jgi:hypothetical protein
LQIAEFQALIKPAIFHLLELQGDLENINELPKGSIFNHKRHGETQRK